MAINTCNISISILCGTGIVGELDHLEHIEHPTLAVSVRVGSPLSFGQNAY